jgi:hypothetical protein
VRSFNDGGEEGNAATPMDVGDDSIRAIQEMDWTAPSAPAYTSNALWQLEALLLRHRQQREDFQNKDSSKNTNTVSVNNDNDSMIDELLGTADFLYGTKLMSSALALVDSCHSLITQVIAPSGRLAYLVRGSKGDETYLCLCSSSAATTGTKTTSSSYAGSVYYCSCRSYLESAHKMSVGMAVSSNNSRHAETPAGVSPVKRPGSSKRHPSAVAGGPPLCKHLLALKLLPHLEGQSDNHIIDSTSSSSNNATTLHNNINNHFATKFCPQQKAVTENEFATILLNHISTTASR